jgi:hypothetical protein
MSFALVVIGFVRVMLGRSGTITLLAVSVEAVFLFTLRIRTGPVVPVGVVIEWVVRDRARHATLG